MCQKKNHFQITVYTYLESQPHYCQPTDSGGGGGGGGGDPNANRFYEIAAYRLRIYGVKEESIKQVIEIRKSDSDRKPVDFEPPEYRIVGGGGDNKFTQMRLHFSQTTGNNNRKRDAKSGRNMPNPDQRYFLLVVEVEAITVTGESFCVCAAASERVIVRVSRIFLKFFCFVCFNNCLISRQ